MENFVTLLIPVLLGAILIIFFILSLCPGDPGSIILGAGADEAAIILGLDR